MTWSGRTALVTGATGLLGSWLTARLLEEGAEVVVLLADLDHRSAFARAGLDRQVRLVPGVLSDEEVVSRAVALGVDTVFHLGAQTLVGPARAAPVATFEANIRGTYLLLDACRRQGCVARVVVASSDKAYGAHDDLPYVESTPLQGRQPYEVSKTCTDLLAQSYAVTYGLPVAVARCGNLYGGGDLNWSRIVPGTMRALLRGEVPVIRSDGTLVRDYLHVDDAVDGYLALAGWLDQQTRPGAEIGFNLSDATPRTVLEMYDAVCRAFGAEVTPDIRGEATDEIPAQHLDPTRAQVELGWKAAVGLDDGLARTLDWYRQLVAA